MTTVPKLPPRNNHR